MTEPPPALEVKDVGIVINILKAAHINWHHCEHVSEGLGAFKPR